MAFAIGDPALNRPLTGWWPVSILPTVSGEDGSLGEIRKALAAITRRLDSLADAVGVAAANTPPGTLLDEPTRTHLAGLQSILAITHGTTPSEAYLLAIDRAISHARADCAAILGLGSEGALTVLAQRGFRDALEARPDEGIIGWALAAADVVQAGPGLGAPDPLLGRHGLGAALVVPVAGATGLPTGALLAGRRRAIPFEREAVALLVMVADRLTDALGAQVEWSRHEPWSTFFASLNPSETAATLARE